MKLCAIFALLIGIACAVAYADPEPTPHPHLEALLRDEETGKAVELAQEQQWDEDNAMARLQEALSQIIGGSRLSKGRVTYDVQKRRAGLKSYRRYNYSKVIFS